MLWNYDLFLVDSDSSDWSRFDHRSHVWQTLNSYLTKYSHNDKDKICGVGMNERWILSV